MRLSICTGMVAAVIALSGATTASAQVSESLINRFGRWTGYGWSEGYHAYDACPACGRRGPCVHHHPNGPVMSRPAPANFAPTMNNDVGPSAAEGGLPWPLFSAPVNKTAQPAPPPPSRPVMRKPVQKPHFYNGPLRGAIPSSENDAPLPAPRKKLDDTVPPLSPQAEARLYPLPPPHAAKAKSAPTSGRSASRYSQAR